MFCSYQKLFFRLSQSAPAILEQDESVTPRGSWAENETIPLDHVMKVLCEKVTQSQSTAEEKEVTFGKTPVKKSIYFNFCFILVVGKSKTSNCDYTNERKTSEYF